MNVLFINHPESDYGEAYLYDGLCRVLGSANVFDFPNKLSYHGKVHTYVTSQIPSGMTCPLAWMPSGYPELTSGASNEDYTRTILDLLRDGFFNLVVCGSLREWAMQYFMIAEPWVRAHNIPVVVHCGEDYAGFPQHDLEKLNVIRPHLILKREVTHQDAPGGVNGARVLPFPFSCPVWAVEDAVGVSTGVEAERDVAFLLGRTHNRRQEVANAIRIAKDIDSYVSLQPDDSPELGNSVQLPWHDYIRLLQKSKCAISVEGFGHDTCRAWEIPSVTVMVRDQAKISIPNDFTHGVNCMLYERADECVQHIRTLRDNPELRAELLVNGIEHLRKYHTTEARARYMLENL